MEELRSTEILDKEIHADARRRAEEILERSEAQARELLDSLGGKVSAARDEREAFYSKKIKGFEANLEASVALERLRFESEFVQSALMARINGYLASLSEQKRLELVLNGADKKLAPAQDKELNVYAYGFDTKKVKDQLSKKIGRTVSKVEKTDFGRLAVEEEFGLDNPQGIIIESDDRQFRCRLTLNQLVGSVLDKSRMELVSVLFGGSER